MPDEPSNMAVRRPALRFQSYPELLAEAWRLAERLNEVQRVGPAGVALVEAAWLEGDPTAALEAVMPWYERVRQYATRGIGAELWYWLRRAGAPVAGEPSDHPYGLLAAGRWREAARAWQQAGCPYEHALALIESGDPADRQRNGIHDQFARRIFLPGQR